MLHMHGAGWRAGGAGGGVLVLSVLAGFPPLIFFLHWQGEPFVPPYWSHNVELPWVRILENAGERSVSVNLVAGVDGRTDL